MNTNNINGLQSNTETLMPSKNGTSESMILRPTLFTCYGRTISEYRLSGCQTMGRPSGDWMPDIPVHAQFISRKHGIFTTEDSVTCYIASSTTNPTKYKGVALRPDESVELKDGDELVIPWTDDEGRDQSVVLVYASTEPRIHMWRDLQKASRDNLTDLIDRDSFAVWWRQNKDNKDYREAVFFILDVDDFKRVNDEAGHNAGDISLKIIAEELRNAVRYETQVSRWGGDEFVGIIPSSVEDAGERLKEISKSIGEKSAEAGVPISVSIGYVDVHDVKDPGDIVEMVELADKAMYNIKHSGKGGIAAYTD